LREQTSSLSGSQDELTVLRRTQDDLNARLLREQQAVSEARRHAQELEVRLRETTADLARARAELESRSSDQGAARSELSKQLASTRDELSALRRLRDELEAKANTQEKALAEARRKADELENRLRESAADNATLKAELDQRGTELESNHGNLEKELADAKAAAMKAEAALKKKSARTTRFESELTSLRKARTDLDGKLKEERKTASQFKRRAKELEERLARSASELERVKNQLTRLSDGKGVAAATDHSDIEMRVRDSIGALARATADLEKERRKLESSALQTRFSSLDASRLGKAFVSSFRSQLRMPAENLMQAIRGLLELPLSDEARRLVDSALESALIVQATVLDDSGQVEPPREAA